MNAGLAVIGVFALVVGLWLFWHKDAPKTCTALFLIAGICSVGALGSLITGLVRTGIRTASSSVGPILGVGISALISAIALVAVLEVVIKGLWKKKAKPKRWHPWLALCLGAIVTASGMPVLVAIFDALSSGLSHVGGTAGHLIGG